MDEQPPKRTVGRPKGKLGIKFQSFTSEEAYEEGQRLRDEALNISTQESAQAPIKPKKKNILKPSKEPKTSTERRKRLLVGFSAREKEFRRNARVSQSTLGHCHAAGCNERSEFRTTDSKPVKRFCRNHALEIRYATLDLHDALGTPLNNTSGMEKKDQIILFGTRSWCCIPKDRLSENILLYYIPASTKRSSIYFHLDLLDRAYEQVRSGQPTNQIWKEVVRGYPGPLSSELKGYSQFLTVLQLFCCWKVKDQEFDHEELNSVKIHSWGFRCPCCFGDPNTTKNIILVNKLSLISISDFLFRFLMDVSPPSDFHRQVHLHLNRFLINFIILILLPH